MNPVYKSKIKYSFKEYASQYQTSLKKYLNEHEDYDEIYFLENEFEFYSKLHYHCDLISDSKIKKNQIEFLNDLAPEIVIGLTKTKEFSDWNYELNEKFKATFKRILNFIEAKKNEYLNFKNIHGVIEKVEENKGVAINNNMSDKFSKADIEKYLVDIVDYIEEDDYRILVDTLYYYLSTGKFPILQKKINFKRINKKKVGWALKEVFKNLKREKLDIEYLSFWKENINLFDKEIIDTENLFDSKFYKIFTTNV